MLQIDSKAEFKTKDELREIAKIIPSLMESKEEFDIVNESMDRLDQIVYLWWRKG